MGRPGKNAASGPAATAPAPTYRDDDDVDALSMHTTASNYEYDDVPELPSYSDSEEQARGIHQPTNTHVDLPSDAYRSIQYPSTNFRSNDGNKTPAVAIGNEISIRMDDRLLDPDELNTYITYLGVVPPRQMIRIQGWHWARRRHNNGKTEKERVFDFDMVFDMTKYLPVAAQERAGEWYQAGVISNSRKAHRGGIFPTRAKGSTQDIEVGMDAHTPSLIEWCRDYCGDKAWLKIFRVTRNVTGVHHEVLHAQILPLIRSTHYRGHVDITSPVADKYVDIYSPHWINNMRISWVRWFFYLTFLWIITWPILFFMTRKWSVYEVDWRFSQPVREHHDVEDRDTGEEQRMVRSATRYATISEKEWVARHAKLIQSLAAEGFQGEATDMPLEVEPRRRGGGTARVPSTGHQSIDNAVSFIQSGMAAWNAISGRDTGGGWGADEM